MVLPPRATTSPAEEAWVGEVVADLLPQDLLLLGVPAVERVDRQRAHELLAIPVVSLTRATSIRMAESLRVTRIVEGSFGVEGRRLELSLRLLDVGRGTLSAPLIRTSPLETLPAMVRSLAWDVALAGPLPPRASREAFLASDKRPQIPLEALRAYGGALLSREPGERRKLLARAIALAPALDGARLELARLQLDGRETAEALATLKPFASQPQRASRFLEGRGYLDLGRYHDAARLYQALSAEAPSPGALNNYALALLRRSHKEGERASDVLLRAIDAGPLLSEPRFNLGWALLTEGDPEGAAFWMRGALKQDPRDTHAKVVLAWSLRQAGHAEEADAEWKDLLARAPSYEPFASPDPGRRFERIMASENPPALEKGGWGEPQAAATHLSRGRKLLEGGDDEGALAELAEAEALDSFSAPTHLEIAHILRSRGETERAIAEWRMSLWCRDDPRARAELADALLSVGRRAEARAEAERSLKAEPGNAVARRILTPR